MGLTIVSVLPTPANRERTRFKNSPRRFMTSDPCEQGAHPINVSSTEDGGKGPTPITTTYPHGRQRSRSALHMGISCSAPLRPSALSRRMEIGDGL